MDFTSTGNQEVSEWVEMPDPEHASEPPALRYFRLSLTSLRFMSSYVRILCQLVTAAYYALLRNRALIVNSYSALTDAISKALLLSMKPSLSRQLVIGERGREGETAAVSEPEKSVHCDVLHDPGAGHRKLDVIFIHGLKGSLERTWKQGMWELKDTTSSGRILLRKSSSASFLNQLKISKVHRQCSEADLPTACKEESGSGEGDGEGEGLKLLTNMASQTQDQAWKLGDDGGGSSGEEDKKEGKKERGRERKVSRCWPKDWLPQDCPGVRVIALNYTTDPYLWRPIWINKRYRTCMSERAWEMMQHLRDLGVGEQPIVWVGHSKGGLFVKQMLVHACESSDPKWTVLSEQSRGILFYSVPHRGSPLANLNLPLLRQSIELTEVQKDSAEVTALHAKFRDLLEGNRLTVQVRSFIETTLTLMSLVYVRIVSVESADAEIGDLYGVPIDHRNICKPRNRDCFLYRELLSLIESVTTSQSSSS